MQAPALSLAAQGAPALRLACAPRPLLGRARRRACTASARSASDGVAAAAIGVGATLLPSLAARADEGMAAAAAAQLPSDPTDVVVGVLFTVAIGALVVLTGGVAYLSIQSWLDSRTETDDRQRIRTGGSSFTPSRPGPKRSSGSSSEEEGPAVKKSPQAPSTAKGFGSAGRRK